MRELSIGLLVILASVDAHATNKLIAVLPLDVSHAGKKLTSDGQASLEEMLRDVATDALASQGWTILTGETTLQVLQDNGVKAENCGSQECHLANARELKADKFISGAVQFVEGDFTASIRLIDTGTGRILASERVEGKSVKELRKDFEAKASDFFKKGGLAEASAPAQPVVIPAAVAARGSLKVTSEPSGAAVEIDGEPAGKTPLKKELEAGSYSVTIEMEGYTPVTKTVAITVGKPEVTFDRLAKEEGWISVAVAPADAQVTVDGKKAGAGKQGPYSAGWHTVRAEAAGYTAEEQRVTLLNGGSAMARLVLNQLPGKVSVTVNVEATCESGNQSVKVSPKHAETLVVPAGDVHVLCKATGYDDSAEDTTVAPAQSTSVKFALQSDATFRAVGVDWQRELTAAVTWEDAKSYCSTLSIAGGGWRVPSREQLKALYIAKLQDAGVAARPGMGDGWYWSSTLANANQVSIVNFADGQIGDQYSAQPEQIRCVR